MRAGDRKPWDVRPYAVWPFELPAIGDPYPRLGAISYDSARRRLFLTQLFGDKDGYCASPHPSRIHRSRTMRSLTVGMLITPTRTSGSGSASWWRSGSRLRASASRRTRFAAASATATRSSAIVSAKKCHNISQY